MKITEIRASRSRFAGCLEQALDAEAKLSRFEPSVRGQIDGDNLLLSVVGPSSVGSMFMFAGAHARFDGELTTQGHSTLIRWSIKGPRSRIIGTALGVVVNATLVLASIDSFLSDGIDSATLALLGITSLMFLAVLTTHRLGTRADRSDAQAMLGVIVRSVRCAEDPMDRVMTP